MSWQTMRGVGIATLGIAVLGMVGPAAASAGEAGEARFVPGELLVRFDRDADAGDRSAALSEVNADTLERLFVPGLRLVEIDGAPVPSAVAELERQPGVRYAEPNFIDHAFAAPNDPNYFLQWALNNTGQDVNGVNPPGPGTPDADIDAPQAWDLTRGSVSAMVAIVDTGVDYTHPDLSPNIFLNPGEAGGAAGVDDDGNGFIDDLRGWDFTGGGDNDPAPAATTSGAHGTQVAGAAGAQGNNGIGVTGVSQEVALLPLRVGPGPTLDLAAQILAFGYARRMGADIVNLSAGGTSSSQARLNAIRAASNTLFVFAAGNDANDNDTSPRYPCVHNEPNVVCVAATTQTDALKASSNYGPGTVDLAAPGELIRTTTPGATYTFANGTSLAAPIMAGAAALIKARYPGDSPARLRTRLLRGVDPNGLPVTSGGRLNVNDSLRADIDAPDTEITSGPKPKVKTRKRKKKAKFQFASSEPGSFQCSVDGDNYEACLSPFKVKVRRGKHELLVRAIDTARNADPTPATHDWKLKRKRRKR